MTQQEKYHRQAIKDYRWLGKKGKVAYHEEQLEKILKQKINES